MPRIIPADVAGRIRVGANLLFTVAWFVIEQFRSDLWSAGLYTKTLWWYGLSTGLFNLLWSLRTVIAYVLGFHWQDPPDGPDGPNAPPPPSGPREIARAVAMLLAACSLGWIAASAQGCGHTCRTSYTAGWVDPPADSAPGARRVQIRCDGQVIDEADIMVRQTWLDKCIEAKKDSEK